MSEESLAFAFRAASTFALEFFKAIDGGDLEATKKLGIVLPEGTRMHAESLALMNRKRREAQAAETL